MKREGFIVAETNLKVYAYCSSLLSIRILDLFVELSVRVPNMVIGRVSQVKTHSAFARGIKAEQIIAYLEQNAHPETKKMDFAVPETFVHQLRLWEGEEQAIFPTAGTLFDAFSSIEQYQAARNHASDLKALLWSNEENRVFFVSQGHEHLVDAFLSESPQ